MEANTHRAIQASATQEASAVKRARFQHDMHDKQLARFQSALGDDLVFGMVIVASWTSAVSFCPCPMAYLIVTGPVRDSAAKPTCHDAES